MNDTPNVNDLAAHASRLSERRRRLREEMARVAAEHASPQPPAPEPEQAP